MSIVFSFLFIDLYLNIHNCKDRDSIQKFRSYKEGYIIGSFIYFNVICQDIKE
jgi:hypothetical protein